MLIASTLGAPFVSDEALRSKEIFSQSLVRPGTLAWIHNWYKAAEGSARRYPRGSDTGFIGVPAADPITFASYLEPRIDLRRYGAG